MTENIEKTRSQPARADKQPARADNITALISFFESGIEKDSDRLGIELEYTIVQGPEQKAVSYHEPQGVRWILEQLEEQFPQTTYDAEGDLLGVARPSEAITLEPAAQLEISAGPFETLDEASQSFEAFEKTLTQLLDPLDYKALTVGYHPTTKALDLEIIPKRRYKFMNFYLSNIGKYGPYMMRGSASTQISIDYSSTEDCLRKLRLSFALVPIFSLITDNAPVFEGAPRTHELVRTEIWKYCDPDRCGIVPGVMEQDFSLRVYAEYILDTPAILVGCKKNEWCYSDKTFGEIYAETPMTLSDVEHAVSMFFNDVRLKTYIEMRPADSLPIPYVIAYAAFIKGLFYDPASLAFLDDLFKKVTAQDIEDAKDALMARGYEATVYHTPVGELADTLMDRAKKGLSEQERHYLDPLAELVSKRTTLARQALLDQPSNSRDLS